MTKIKFGTDGWRAIIAKDYTVDNVARVAKATADWLMQDYEKPSLVLGYDCRFGGELFAETTIKVLASQGVKVFYDAKFTTTPMVSYGAFKLGANAGVVITASHNPPSYNGYKLKAGYGGPSVPAEITRVEDLIPESCVVPEAKLSDIEAKGLLEYVNLESLYFEHIDNSFDLEAINNSGIIVAYDPMYGAGQRVMHRILKNMHPLHYEYNPSFYGQAPEPIHRNLLDLSRLIKETDGIDCGLAHDGDADRIGMYDGNGKFVDSHHIILLLIHYLHKYKGMDGKVVIAFSVSPKAKKLCAHYGIEVEVTKIGFKYICGRMVEVDVLLGGEESGGIAVKGHIPERDGIWCGLLLLEFMAKTGKSLEDLIAEVYEIVGPFSFDRNDLHIDESLKQAIIKNCKDGVYKEFGKYKIESIETIDGFKYHLGEERWVMVRPSGTEPVLRVYAEGRNEEEAKDILKETIASLKG